MKYYYVYIISNFSNSTLYIGITSNLEKRIYQHVKKLDSSSFSSRYNLKKLVYYEEYRDIRVAIEREKQLKGWKRKKKDDLITKNNPEWKEISLTDSSNESLCGFASE